jgi:hypothetical protein
MADTTLILLLAAIMLAAALVTKLTIFLFRWFWFFFTRLFYFVPFRNQPEYQQRDKPLTDDELLILKFLRWEPKTEHELMRFSKKQFGDERIALKVIADLWVKEFVHATRAIYHVSYTVGYCQYKGITREGRKRLKQGE